MESAEAAAAMKFDGARRATLVILVDALVEASRYAGNADDLAGLDGSSARGHRPCMSDESITEWFASIYLQSQSTVAMILDMVRTNGESVSDYVVIVADVTDEATRFFVDQLGEAPTDPGTPGFVGAYPKEAVARVLRMLDAETFAADAEKPLDDGLMRLLIAARGQMQCADIRAAAPMSRGGSA